MVLLMTAGIGLILIGLAAIGYGIPVKEFSFGNTLIVTGAIAVGSGTILLGLRAALVELLAALGPSRQPTAAPLSAAPSLREPAQPSSRSASPMITEPPPADDGHHGFDRSEPHHGYDRAEQHPAAAEAERDMPPWQKDAERERVRHRAMAAFESPQQQPLPLAEPAPPESAPPPSDAEAAAEIGRQQRRNLLFHSTRRERLRTPSGEAITGEGEPPPLGDLRRSAFDEAWPESERQRGDRLRRRASESSIADDRASTQDDAKTQQPQDEASDKPAGEGTPGEVTLLKSGEVDGMAYSLFSDGSMEAQMPEGKMRFASIEELRAYLDQRG